MVKHVGRGKENSGRVGDVLEGGGSESVSSSGFEDAVLGRVAFSCNNY